MLPPSYHFPTHQVHIPIIGHPLHTMAPFAETPIMSFRETPTVEVFKEPDLLDGWWTSEKLFSLERRAVFSTVAQFPLHSHIF